MGKEILEDYKKRNESEEKLNDFCYEQHLKIVNTLFKKKEQQQMDLDFFESGIQKPIGFTLAPMKNNTIKNFDVIRQFDFYSDYRSIIFEGLNLHLNSTIQKQNAKKKSWLKFKIERKLMKY